MLVDLSASPAGQHDSRNTGSAESKTLDSLLTPCLQLLLNALGGHDNG